MKLLRVFFALCCLVWLTGATWLPLFQKAPSGNDPATTAWVNAVVTAGGTVSGPRTTIVNTFIVCLKTNSLFTTMDRYWLLAGENVASATVDMIADASNSPVGGVTFTANLGYGPAVNTGTYVDTVATSYTNFSQNSATFGGQIQTTTATTAANYFAYGAANGAFTQVSSFKPETGTGGATGFTEFRINSSGNDGTGSVSTPVGSWANSRTALAVTGLYYNGSISAPGGAGTTTSTGLPGVSFFILGGNQGGSDVAIDTFDVISSFFIAGGWNGTQVAAFEGCQNAMMTSIGINVH